MEPEELKYSREHEWARVEETGVRVGITNYAQEALGDVVYVDLPAPGTKVSAGQPLGEVESTKSVSDVYAPVGGTILERNPALDDAPELVNQEPYAQGWMVLIAPDDPTELEALLTAVEYEQFLETQTDA